MCIAILNLKGRLSNNVLKTSAISNPDGAGIAYVKSTTGELKVFTSLKPMDVISKYKAVRKVNSGPILLHFRLATKGDISTDNCHPFSLGNDLCVAHNGTLEHYDDENTSMSDTAMFVEDILKHVSHDELYSDHMNALLGQAIGKSKLVFLFSDGRHMITNEQNGHWDQHKTTWFSNYGYSKQSRRYQRMIEPAFEKKTVTKTYPIKSNYKFDFRDASYASNARLGECYICNRVLYGAAELNNGICHQCLNKL